VGWQPIDHPPILYISIILKTEQESYWHSAEMQEKQGFVRFYIKSLKIMHKQRGLYFQEALMAFGCSISRPDISQSNSRQVMLLVSSLLRGQR
jgi:hypothetical protein